MKVITLGFVCYIKELIKLTSYDKDSDIFDWMNTFYFSKIILSLNNNFNIFENMSLSKLDCDKNNKQVLYNENYDFRLPHEQEYFINPNIIINKYKRRYERFINYKNEENNFLFLRIVNLRGRYGKNKEDLINEYNEYNYNDLIKHLPQHSHILLLVDGILDNNIKDNIYNKFIVLDNIIHPGFVAGGDLNKYKPRLLEYYNNFFKLCDSNFNNLENIIQILNNEISMDRI